jgi:hypothetical protein
VETTSFILDRKKFHHEMLSIKKLTPKYFKTGVAQINILPEQIEIHVVGITKYISALTEGCYDVLVPIRLLYAYSSTITTPELKFEVKPGEIRCGVSVFSSPEIKLRPIFNTNNDVMPLNADEFDLLKYAYRASESELADFGLSQKVKNAQEKLRISISEALIILGNYRITYSDLEDLIIKKFKT